MIEIKVITSEKDINRYIRFSADVYKDNPVWVPPIVEDQKKFLLGNKLFFKHCRHEVFLAEKNSVIVARCAVFYDSSLNDHWKIKAGMIGFFEALPNEKEAVRLLFEKAELALKNLGAEVIWGPMDGGLVNLIGLLQDTFDESPACMMAYSQPYYKRYFLDAGYSKNKELNTYVVDLMDDRLKKKINSIIKLGQKRTKIKIRGLNKKNFKEDIFRMSKIYNTTFAKHWGYSPMDEEETYDLLSALKSFMDEDFLLFAEDETGRCVGFVFALADFNKVVHALRGDLGVHNFIKMFRLQKKIKEARFIAIGTLPEMRGESIVPLLAAHVYKALINRGFIRCENSWIFKENRASISTSKKFYGKLRKTYQIYQKMMV